jgi:23S rRNA (cytidine1920-2'-O)/16S rRNA (cytidine1409-2'-O)-methyltransferase
MPNLTPKTAKKIKAADLAVERGLADTRSKAQALILAGRILSDGEPVQKAGLLLPFNANLTLKEGQAYVSRGGFKLAGALDAFGLDPKGFKALDAGASTGGFTDCLLRRGAALVVAADVGAGLLDWSLRRDPRVVAVENQNLRLLTTDDGKRLMAPFDLIVCDLSFISLKLILPPLCPFVKPKGFLLALVKPQFEVGRHNVGKKGVVRDPDLIKGAVAEISEFAKTLNPAFDKIGEAPSVLTGAKGNQEVFILLKRRETGDLSENEGPKAYGD